ncbi:pectate lyase [Phytophthora sojae]|uniref:Probable pectate lyase F n=1 Tax=Phytophthora sojae (strain P6497) TaxID=1094619 RepID=G4ZB47_PHYSP|nr:pectate lyase [Phytophthora sojae]EGZ22013.1 pectate lyase [Phytophthora sojae]|eukprot:XP_009524730.1 pectate lyase [Phytophthora sojae]
MTGQAGLPTLSLISTGLTVCRVRFSVSGPILPYPLCYFCFFWWQELLDAHRAIKAGEVFDGKMQTFERSDITCTDGEGQKDSAVFLVEAGGTLKNAIIGKNQKEGVHCDDHDCTIENVWWDDVCEDALSIKGGTASSVTTVTNCGARYASDKVVQHNGYGTVKINGFFAQEFGKLYRSCGTCGDIPRTVTVENVYAIDPLVSLVTVNKNYNDQATLKNIYVKTTDGKGDVKVCQWSQGSKTPSNLGDGPSGTLCQYTESDVHINEK